jgi:hypothetical protein
MSAEVSDSIRFVLICHKCCKIEGLWVWSKSDRCSLCLSIKGLFGNAPSSFEFFFFLLKIIFIYIFRLRWSYIKNNFF